LPMIPVAVGVAFVKRRAAQALLMLAISVGTKALTAILKEAGHRAGGSVAKAADQFEEKARHNAELSAAELEAKKRFRLSTFAAADRAIAAGLREVLTLIEQNADDATVESVAVQVVENLKGRGKPEQPPDENE